MQEEEDIAGPEIRYLGDTALAVEFADISDPGLIRRIHALDAAFNRLKLPGVVETVPSYRSMTIHIDPVLADPREIETAVRRLASRLGELQAPGRHWEVPVAYGGERGFDLEVVAARAGMTPGDAIDMHAGVDYLVAMIGFLPGFAYLSGLAPALETPRRAEPRQEIPASSISIGGRQTAIGSLAGPSGWHVIGRTPVRPFQRGRDPEFLFEPGDHVRFRPISEREWIELNRKTQAGVPVARRLNA